MLDAGVDYATGGAGLKFLPLHVLRVSSYRGCDISNGELLLSCLGTELKLGDVKSTLLQGVLHLLQLLLSGPKLLLTLPFLACRAEGAVQQQGDDNEAEQ